MKKSSQGLERRTGGRGTLTGNDDNDILDGGSGADVMDGSFGNDSVAANDSEERMAA